MRIIAGDLKGRVIKSPPGSHTRPTSDKVRGAIFNMLASMPAFAGFEGAHVLDLFAGTGALGIEALSRGAVRASFVEHDRKTAARLMATLNNFGLDGRSKVHCRDATRLGDVDGAPFNLVFADPPYGKNRAEPALLRANSMGVLANDVIVVLEERADLEPMPKGFELIERRSWGDTAASFFTRP